MTVPHKENASDALPTGFWWLSAILLLVIAAGLIRSLLMTPFQMAVANIQQDARQQATHNIQYADHPADTAIGTTSAVNEAAYLAPARTNPSTANTARERDNTASQQHSSTDDLQALAIAASDRPSTTNGLSPEASPNAPGDGGAQTASTKPRLPARESLDTLLSTIEDRKTNSTARYRSLRNEKHLSRSEKVKASSEYTHENFQALCADCHLLHDAPDWQADLGPDVCQKVNCNDHRALSFYINRFMPPEDPSLCEGACASELALFVLYRGNAALAAMHQMAPALFMQAGIEIRDTESGTVILSRPPLTAQ